MMKLLQVGLLLFFINYFRYTPHRDETLSSNYSTQFLLYKRRASQKHPNE